MVKVKVFTLGEFREIMGEKEIEVELPSGSDVFYLLKAISEENDELFKMIFEFKEEEKCLSSRIRILVNGRTIHALEGIKTKLKEGDVVSLIPPISGGLHISLFNSF